MGPVTPFEAGVTGLVIAMFAPVAFFGLLALRDWVLAVWSRPKPEPAAKPEPRVLTEGDRAWSDVLHAWWKAQHGRNDVQGDWDALDKPVLLVGADTHPPG